MGAGNSYAPGLRPSQPPLRLCTTTLAVMRCTRQTATNFVVPLIAARTQHDECPGHTIGRIAEMARATRARQLARATTRAIKLHQLFGRDIPGLTTHLLDNKLVLNCSSAVPMVAATTFRTRR